MNLPIKALKPLDDVLANHNDEFTVRGIWGAEYHKEIPDGFKGVLVKRESTRETRYILIPAAECEKMGWTKVINPVNFEEWKRK
jgi:hypothetical protein